MKILITGASGQLARAIAAELSDEHKLRLMGATPVDVEADFEYAQGSILDADDAQRAVEGIDVLIHTGDPPPDLPSDGLACEQMLLDLATRGTHNLFEAAISAGVKRLIYAGTLAIFRAYSDDIYISEEWKPLPSPEATQMTRYLAEQTCREFAREYMVTVTCLRLGELVLEEDVEGEEPNLTWLDLRDAAHAFRCALRRDTSDSVQWWRRWAVYHICANIPNPRFLIGKASREISYKPTHNFHAHYQAASKDG